MIETIENSRTEFKVKLFDVIQEIAKNLYTGCPINKYYLNEDKY